MDTLRLYFIAILPDQSIQNEVTDFKNLVASKFHSSHALKSPSHITLISPLKVRDSQIGEVENILKEIAVNLQPFELELNDFGMFAPRVIYVQVTNLPILGRIKKQIEQQLINIKLLKSIERREYHPHMTIAHRDLTRSRFHPAWAHFSNEEYHRTFTVDKLSLLEHKNKRWEVLKSFGFG